MALRQRLMLPGFEWQVREELQAVRAMRPPVNVEFRRGAKSEDVVQDMMPHASVKLCAAVGSGKSVKMPAALASKTRALVFHVVPNRQLVGHLYSYLVKVSQANPSDYRTPIDRFHGDVDMLPRNGVFVVSAVDMVDIMMRHGGLHKFKGCSVFLDEAHESDAYTHVVRTLAVQMGAERLVQASATFDPTVRGVRNTPGTVVMKPVELGDPEEWEVDRVGSPFHMASMRDGVLVFVDSRKAAAKLTMAYERVGMRVFSLTASSSDEEVAAATRAASDKNEGLVAILADYTYRSGFTFPLSRVVDTGLVSYYDPRPGEFRRLNRRMFQFEREQAAGRVGRVAGNAEYYYQKGECEAVMCDLEGVEKEAAAYIFQCLGFKPDVVLSSAFMANNRLPVGVSVRAALNGAYPLSYYVKNADEASKVPENSYIEGVKPAILPPSYVDSVNVGDDKSSKQRSDKGVVGSSDLKSKAAVGDWDSVIDELVSSDDAQQLQDGVYHISQVRDSLGRGVAGTMTFPAGLRSVREFAMRKGFAFSVASLSREDRMWAFSALLDSYNAVTAKVRGTKRAVREAMMVARGRGFKDKAIDIIEELSADHADALSCLRAAEVFCMSSTWSIPCDDKLKSENTIRDTYYDQLVSKVRSRGHSDLEEDLEYSVGKHLKKVVQKSKDKGEDFGRYQGRKLELAMPSWMGGKCITYDRVQDAGDVTTSISPASPGGGRFFRKGYDRDDHDDYEDYDRVKTYTYIRTVKWTDG